MMGVGTNECLTLGAGDSPWSASMRHMGALQLPAYMSSPTILKPSHQMGI